METATPMLQQYERIKSQHKDCILFFRLGDFYEMFFDDAQVGSRVLDLVLTSRGKGTSHHVPMCGLPYHAAESYIAKLIKAGYKVAICEQVEDPAQAKGLVERDVIRIISSGTFLDETSADARLILTLAAPGKNEHTIGFAFTDPASGTIQANIVDNPTRVLELIARLPVCECVYPLSDEETLKPVLRHPLIKTKNIFLSAHEDWCFNPELARKNLCEHFGVHNLAGFGLDGIPLAVGASGALLEYLKQMNKQPLKHIDKLALYTESDAVYISPAAVYGLELPTLFKTIDHALTAVGKRKLREWIFHPLKVPAAILQRQAAVTLLKNATETQRRLKDHLSHFPDIEKSVSKLSCGYTHARDILAIRNALSLLPDLKESMATLVEKNRLFTINDVPDLRDLLEKAVNPDMPLTNAEGKIIRPGFHAELDQLRALQETGRNWLKNFQEQEIKRSGINSLKVGFNKIFGYYIEITKVHLKNVPADYIRKQTLVNGERYITPELKEYEEKILTAQEKILKIENDLLRFLQNEILDKSSALHEFAQAVATIDAIDSLSLLAQSPKYTAPAIADDTVLDIKEGRHPVVEKTSRESFVPNDVFLDCDENHLVILTGPNMAGKSTYIRQIALLVILAQAGSYVPAASAHVGVVDKIFTRIGAHDDIAKGQSTFMVEMTETADILNNVSDRSLIILDEIGRGTSTFDGLSLAWAIAEYLQKTKARTLFATHFHELTALSDEHSGIKNYNVAVKEWKDEIIFLHKIVEGSTDDSYGIYVAKLAGVPGNVLARAKNILTRLEMQGDLKEKITGQASLETQLNLFSGGRSDPLLDEITAEIQNLDVNALTPLAALNKLEEIKKRLLK